MVKRSVPGTRRAGWVPAVVAVAFLLGAGSLFADAMDPNHPGDVFVRMDNQATGGTLIYKFDKDEVPVHTETSTYWDPSFPSEGLSVDKYERMLVVRAAADSNVTPSLSRGQYQEIHIPTGVSTTKSTPQGTTVPIPANWQDYFWIPDPLLVGGCKPPYTLSYHSGGYCAPGGPKKHPPGMSNNRDMPYYQQDRGFDWELVGYKNWAVTHGTSGYYFNKPQHSIGGLAIPPRDPTEPGQRTPRIYENKQRGNILTSPLTITATAKNKQIVAYLDSGDVMNDPGALTGLGCPPQCDGVEIGNRLVTEIQSQVGYSFFSTCGDSCISGPSSATADAYGPEPPTRILFGSEGQTINDQKAYTVKGVAGGLEVKALSLVPQGGLITSQGVACGNPTGCWDESDVPEAKKYFTYGTTVLTANSFGNAASLDSYLAGGSDFVYLSDKDPDHFAVSSRFWRTGGTAFTYEPSEGAIKWLEHAFDTSGSFAPPSPTEGKIVIGDIPPSDVAITADGKGNVYWLRRTLTPPHQFDTDGDTYDDVPDPTTMLNGSEFDPNWLTAPGPNDDSQVNYSGAWYVANGTVPPAHAGFYVEQKDDIPADDNPERQAYTRDVRIRQYPSYELLAYNYITDGFRSNSVNVTIPPESLKVAHRGTVARGYFEYVYHATCPQIVIPERYRPTPGVSPNPAVSGWTSSTSIGNTTYLDMAVDPTGGSAANPPFSMQRLIDAIAQHYDGAGEPLGDQFACTGWQNGPWVDKPDPNDGRTRLDTQSCKRRYLTFTAVDPVPAGDPAPDNSDVYFVPPDAYNPWPALPAWPTGLTTPTVPQLANAMRGGCAPIAGIRSNENDDPNISCSQGNIETGTHVFVMEVTESRTRLTDEDLYYERGPPDFTQGYSWYELSAANPQVQALNEDDFQLDMAAVNVTEPPNSDFQESYVDVVVDGADVTGDDMIIEEGDSPRISIENPPKFAGIFTVPSYGTMNEQVPGAAGCCSDENGNSFTGHFGRNVVQANFDWRWRVVALSGGARYAYHQGAVAVPDPSNDGVIYKTEWSDATVPGNDAFEMEILGNEVTFDDPGKYRIVLDVRGTYWKAGGPLTFFSRPEPPDIQFLPFVGVYDLKGTPDITKAPNGDAATAFAGMPDDQLEYDNAVSSGNAGMQFARLYREVLVQPEGPSTPTYITNLQLAGPLEVQEDVGGEAEEGGAAGVDLPGSMTLAAREDRYISGAADDDLTQVTATMNINWYRADDYRYDADLAGRISFGNVDTGGGTPNMEKLDGVGTFFRPGECGAPFDAANAAHIKLRNDGLLASMHAAPIGQPANPNPLERCQTHVAHLSPRDWYDIQFRWYMKVDDPVNAGSYLPANSGSPHPDLGDLGALVAQGTFAELLELEKDTAAMSDLGLSGKLLQEAGTDYPDNRSFTAVLPLYGRDASGNFKPLEIAVPTEADGTDKKVYFTAVVDYPKVRWVLDDQDDAGNAVYFKLDDNGTATATYGAGDAPSPNAANPAAATSFYHGLVVRDRTAPWLVGTANLGGGDTAAGRTLATTGSEVTFIFRDNNPYQSATWPKITRLRYGIGEDARTRWSRLWSTDAWMGVGATLGGDHLGFDLSWEGGDASPVAQSFLRDPGTNSDFLGAPANGHGNLVWYYGLTSSTGAGNIVADSVDSATLDPTNPPMVELTGPPNEPPTVFRDTAAPEGPQVSPDAPLDWVRWYKVNDVSAASYGLAIGSGEPGNIGNAGNYADRHWSTDHWNFPLSPFVGASGPGDFGDDLTMGVESQDAFTLVGDIQLQSLPSQRVEDRSPPNVIVELLDHRSATPVFFSVVTDFRQPYGPGLPLADEPGWDDIRVLLGPDMRAVMGDERRDVGTDFEGRFDDPADRTVDFGDLALLTNDGLDTPNVGTAENRWVVEEDVTFRIRVVVSDNSAPPENIGVGIRSAAAAAPANALPSFPRVGWDGSDDNPPPVGPTRVIAGKVVFEAYHQYPLEGTDDVIEVVVCDHQAATGCGNMRKIRIPVRSVPHDTEFRVISDRVQRGSD